MQARLTGRARPRSQSETVHEAKPTAAAAADSEGACAKAASARRCKAALPRQPRTSTQAS